MKFESTQIAIRERSFAEVMDLALRVTATHAPGLLLALVLGAGPFWALNTWVASLPDGFDYHQYDPAPFAFWTLWAMVVEAPIAMAPVTLYLGQLTFHRHVSWRRLGWDYLKSLPQMMLFYGVLMVVLAVTMIGLLLPYLSWPYLNEVILLERNPLFGRRGGPVGVLRRSRNLHKGAGADLFGPWVLASGSYVLLWGALLGGIATLAPQLSGENLGTTTVVCFLAPACAWLVLGYGAVVRFLAYLDLRIRREGWEVELTMRAEGARLAQGG